MVRAQVLDKGTVDLEGVLGDDLAVVNAARVSFARRDGELGDAGRGLIGYLMTNGHGTPFEHVVFQFRIKAPIFVAREWMRHRIASYNEWSQRYSQVVNEFYVPAYFRTQVGKPGAYSFEPLSPDRADVARKRLREAHDNAFSAYEELLELGVARELASRVLPTTVYTQFIFTTNARSLMNFMALRNSEHAQFEIRAYAQVIEAMFAEAMPVTHAAFVAAGRNAP
jgi:thymidylate synthase (FAD)